MEQLKSGGIMERRGKKTADFEKCFVITKSAAYRIKSLIRNKTLNIN